LSWLIFCVPGTFVLEAAIVGGTSQHRHHYEDVCVQCSLPYYRFLNTKTPNKEKYPDAVIDDCLIDAAEYVDVVKRIIRLKEGPE
jgi:hypothetical protein